MIEQNKYSELSYYTLSHGGEEFIHLHAVDAYAAKFTESISLIKTAETYRDTEPYDTPIRLVELVHPQADFV